jgi:hypothetical protein
MDELPGITEIRMKPTLRTEHVSRCLTDNVQVNQKEMIWLFSLQALEKLFFPLALAKWK